MKRHPPSESSASRSKSLRIAEKLEECVLQQRMPRSIAEGNNDPLGREFVRSSCDKYNRYLHFAQNYHACTPQSAPSRHGQAIARITQEIDNIIKDAEQQLWSKYFKLCEQQKAFSHSVIGLKDSYEAGDLLSLEQQELEDFLTRLNIEDTKRYINYVQRILKEAVVKEAPFDERQPGGSLDHNDSDAKFLLKALQLVQPMIHAKLDKSAFQTLVLVKTLYRTSNRRIEREDQKEGHQKIDFVIRRFVNDKKAIPKTLGEEDGFFLGYAEDESAKCSSVQDAGLTWRWCLEQFDHRHWDFASAARTLRPVYFGVRCVPIRHFKSEFDSACFHEDSLELLDRLQVKAWSEIRVKMLLTAGKILPIELVERIFEYALEAEGVPSEPSVTETFMLGPQDCKIRQQGRNREVARLGKRTKPLYNCDVMRNQRPERIYEHCGEVVLDSAE